MSSSNAAPTHESQGDILVSRFSALGDVAMTLAPLYDACRANPQRRFILLTRKHPAALFINSPENLVIEAIDTSDYSGISGIRRLYKKLREKYNITVYADLHDVLRTQLLRLMFRLGGGVKIVHIDKGRGARRRLTRHRHKHLVRLQPMHERYRATLEEAGTPAPEKFSSIFTKLPDPEIFAKASQPKKEGEYWVAIAPFAAHAGKVYPADKMLSVISGLIAKPNLKIFILGFGDAENLRIEQWREKISEAGADAERVVNMAALKIGLPAEMALMAHCDVMLSMDSANMHLASLAATRVVSIWGATHPYAGFCPRGVNESDILQLNMTCRPCSVFGQRKCYRNDYHCLRGINPSRIVDVVLNPPSTSGDSSNSSKSTNK